MSLINCLKFDMHFSYDLKYISYDGITYQYNGDFQYLDNFIFFLGGHSSDILSIRTQ